MSTQDHNSTREDASNPQKRGETVMNELMDMEVLVRHMMSNEYRQAMENEMVTPILARLLLQKIQKACDAVTGEDDEAAAVAQ